MNLPLQIVNIQPSANGYCARGHEIEQFYRQSKDAGAELTILFDDDFAAATAKFARKAGAKQIVTQLLTGKRRAGRLCPVPSQLGSPPFRFLWFPYQGKFIISIPTTAREFS